CRRRATTVLSAPAAHASTTRARRATCGADRERCASDSSRCRSSAVRISATLGRPVRMLASLSSSTSGPHHLFHSLLGHDTRLTSAIVQGGELTPLVAALQTYEQRRAALAARVQVLQVPRQTIDRDAVRRRLDEYVADWQKLLRGHVRQAQQILRRLVKGRL